MKVVTPQEMTRIEALAYAEGFQEEEFMEAAGRGVAQAAEDLAFRMGLEQEAILLCGKGNNAGDAYVAGRLLRGQGFGVLAIQVGSIESASPLCQKNHRRFIDEGGEVLALADDVPIEFSGGALIIDGLFGTGFQGEAKDLYAKIIHAANDSRLPILAVDVPSGLDGETGEAIVAIRATETVFLELPKAGFFFSKGHDHVGRVRYAPFGLESRFVDQAESNATLLFDDDMRRLVPSIRRSRHKYEAGFVVAVAGSPGMPGAAMLASLACLRSGAGIVHLYHPAEMGGELAGSSYELVKRPYQINALDPLLSACEKASSFLLGPGIGISDSSRTVVKQLLLKVKVPTIIDADALNIIAEEGLSIPSGAVLTPHVGEMRRLLGITEKCPVDSAFLDKCQAYSEGNQVHLIVKGGPTFIVSPGEKLAVCTMGDPGMATAGTGDVLSGVVAALLAQGMNSGEAARLACYLHGLAGEDAATNMTSYSMIASDVIESLAHAFAYLT